jgi:ubiquinone/menaquinone biosynthesis C-methylase UbiE
MMVTVAMGSLAENIYKDYVEKLALRGDERVLDFGTGSGNPALHLARKLQGRGGRLTCVDVSERWMKLARRRLRRFSNVDYYLGDITWLDILPASQDIVFLHFVLHEIPPAERPEIVRRLCARLAAGGKLYVREPLRFISEAEILQLVGRNGLREESSSTSEIKTQGFVYEGVFCNGIERM